MSQSLRLMPLGINGYMPSAGRQTMAFLVLVGEEGAILLDAGSGVARLLEPEPREMLAGRSALDVILTHYHLDHVIGLSYLPGVRPAGKVRIHAPGPPLVDADPAEALCRLIHPPLFPIPLSEFPMPIELERLTAESCEIAGLPVRLRRQSHPGGSVGLRLGDALAYVTDTVADQGTVELARGVDLLLHEVWAGSGEEVGAGGHSAAADVAEIARAAGVRRLMPIHHHPARTEADLERLGVELQGLADGVEVVHPLEGRVYEIGGASER